MRNLVTLLVLLAVAVPAPQHVKPATEQEGIAVYFSPEGGCTDAIVEVIANTRRTLDVQAYSFTSTAIAKAISQAHERGVKLRVILDLKATGDQYSGATFLANHGVPTFTDGEHPIAHNKVMIADGQTIITGSFNFTRQAETSNAENLLIISGKPKLAKAYSDNFSKHLAHSKSYEKR